jgi:outer membrane protein OmpA-like peptidoglycan-associated protein
MSNLPKKAEDRVNTFAIVLVGTAAGILLWATMVALQAYYLNTAGEMEAERDGVELARERRSVEATQQANLARLERNEEFANAAEVCYRTPIELAMANVVADAQAGKTTLVPAVGAHDKPTLVAIPGYPASEGAAVPGAPAGPGAGAAVSDREIVLASSVVFEEADAAITEASAAALDSLAELLEGRPEITEITIVVAEADVELALVRAEAVRTYLLEAGVEPERIATTGVPLEGDDLAGVRFQITSSSAGDPPGGDEPIDAPGDEPTEPADPGDQPTP